MGKSRWKGLPARASRAALAAVLVAGLTPWGSGVALADEPPDDSLDTVGVQSSSGTVFYGNSRNSYLEDDYGYPLYDENGDMVQGPIGASITKVENAGDTLYIPGVVDLVETDRDGNESVVSGVRLQSLSLDCGDQGDSSLGKIKHLVIEDASMMNQINVSGLPSLESIEVCGDGNSVRMGVSSCDKLTSIQADGGRIAYLFISSCSSFKLENIDRNLSTALKSLAVSWYSGSLSFDGSAFPSLESLNVYRSDLVSYSLSPCKRLSNVSFISCGLTEIDLSEIPETVTSFNCSDNRIADTSSIVERFGSDSAQGQFASENASSSGLKAIDQNVSNGYVLAGSTAYVDLYESFTPGMNQTNYYNENMTARNALSNFSVECDDSSVLSCALLTVNTPSMNGSCLVLEGKTGGTALVRVRYHFEGSYGVYDGTQEVSVLVAESANPISAINSVESISANAVTDCAICNAAGVPHQEGFTKQSDLLAVVADPSRSFTQDQELKVESSDATVADAYIDQRPADTHSSLKVRIRKPGDTVIRISVYRNGQPTGVAKEIPVHVAEQVDPVLDVKDSVTLVYRDSSSAPALGDYAYNFACYEKNGAIEALARTHQSVSYWADSSINPDVNYLRVSSDKPNVVSFSRAAGMGQTRYTVKGIGYANVSFEDLWGNKGICKVSTESKSTIASGIHLAQKEITVTKGEEIDLEQYIEGRDSLTGIELNALEPFVFASDDKHIASFKADKGNRGEVLRATEMMARGVGDVTVWLCYSDAYLTSDDYYNGTWPRIGLDSMTIHVVAPAQKEVAVPSPQHLTYNGSEQVAFADTEYYTVTGGKATDAGEYVAKLSLKDKEGSVWADTGTSDDVEVEWAIAPAPMGLVDVSGVEGPYPYTGKAIEPDAKCSFNGKALEKGKDFDLAFSDNVNVGQGKVAATGKGNFSGTVERTFSIEKNAGGWVGSSKGWWYDNGDGTYPANCWREIDGATYRFDASGYMRTGWASVDGSWYWLGSAGDGKMATGWRSIGGSWYWFADGGRMATGWTGIYGSWYLFSGSGAMLTGWQSVGGTWYYLAGSGKMATGWQSVGGAWYWFAGSGRMASGWQQIGGPWYLFNGSGAMLTGWQSVGGTWYWLASSGVMATGWQQIGGAWYWFDGSGRMATGWFKVGGTYYYANGSGAMQSNRWVGSYYLTGSGAMLTNAFTPDGYYVGPDGAWQYIYWTPNGSAYHKTKDCPSLSRSTNIISGTLAGAGKRTACKNCWH